MFVCFICFIIGGVLGATVGVLAAALACAAKET